jgi:hypothetical protein
MRLTHSFLAVAVFSLSLTPALCPAPAAAQQGPAAVPCTGTVNIIRVSDIKPGMMDQFMAAVAAQAAWYKKVGTTDQIQVLSILDRDPAAKAWSSLPTEVITFHILQAGRPDPAHDAGYDAFVKMFNDVSTIKTTYITCLGQQPR